MHLGTENGMKFLPSVVKHLLLFLLLGKQWSALISANQVKIGQCQFCLCQFLYNVIHRGIFCVCGISQWVFMDFIVFYAVFISCGITVISPLGRFGFSVVLDRQGIYFVAFVLELFTFISPLCCLSYWHVIFWSTFSQMIHSSGFSWLIMSDPSILICDTSGFFSPIQTVTHKRENNMLHSYCMSLTFLIFLKLKKYTPSKIRADQEKNWPKPIPSWLIGTSLISPHD